jgi:hypothetical protein
LQQSLQTAVSLDATGRILNVLGLLALTLVHAGDRETALALLLFVTRHPASAHATRERVAQELAELKGDAALLAAAEKRAAGLDLDTAVSWCKQEMGD